MERRRYLTVLGAASFAGCANIPFFSSPHSLGETVSFSVIDITVNDAMTAETIELDGEQLTAPTNAIFALFRVKAHNNDITAREIPVVNFANYRRLRNREEVIELAGVNDIRVFGSGDGGYLPQEATTVTGYERLAVVGNPLQTYPAGHVRPSIGATQTISGWVFGLIGREKTPQLKIVFKGESELWTAKSADLSTPEPRTVL